MTDEHICANCKFFQPEPGKDSCSTLGKCIGAPISTVDEKGFQIYPIYPRRDNSDEACGMFKMSEDCQ